MIGFPYCFIKISMRICIRILFRCCFGFDSDFDFGVGSCFYFGFGFGFDLGWIQFGFWSEVLGGPGRSSEVLGSKIKIKSNQNRIEIESNQARIEILIESYQKS